MPLCSEASSGHCIAPPSDHPCHLLHTGSYHELSRCWHCQMKLLHHLSAIWCVHPFSFGNWSHRLMLFLLCHSLYFWPSSGRGLLLRIAHEHMTSDPRCAIGVLDCRHLQGLRFSGVLGFCWMHRVGASKSVILKFSSSKDSEIRPSFILGLVRLDWARIWNLWYNAPKEAVPASSIAFFAAEEISYCWPLQRRRREACSKKLSIGGLCFGRLCHSGFGECHSRRSRWFACLSWALCCSGCGAPPILSGLCRAWSWLISPNSYL